MAQPIELKTRKQIVNERCIGICEELLQRAKSGDVESVFVIAFHTDGDYAVLISESMDAMKKIGAIERLKYSYMEGS